MVIVKLLSKFLLLLFFAVLSFSASSRYLFVISEDASAEELEPEVAVAGRLEL